jgi:kumamolisin
VASELSLPLDGSDRQAPEGARRVAPAPRDELVEVTVVVRPRRPTGERVAELAALDPRDRVHLSRAELAQEHGAEPEDLGRVEEFARGHGLETVETRAERRSLVLRGPVEAMEAAFGVELGSFEHPGGRYRGREGTVRLPADLEPVVTAVLGLDDRPQAVPYARVQEEPSTHAYTPPELARLYGFPASLDGTGETIAVLEVGGGYTTSDISAYFAKLGTKPPPLVDVGVDGMENVPGKEPSYDGEVTLDVEVAAAAASGATILVYFAPNTARGYYDAITAIVHDKRAPSVISLSWGSAEGTWTAQALKSIDEACQAAALAGVTICVASGDAGSFDFDPDGRANTDFPASSPHVLGCGGTRLESSGGTIASEVAWGVPNGPATGGGISDVFGLPAWQSAAHVPPSVNPGGRVGRGVPDVSADADPDTGYSVHVRGKDVVMGGTSAAAPLWAGLVARINQHLGHRIGFLSPTLYGLKGGLRDITSGSNGAYRAGPGWDACTGLGSPQGEALMAELSRP